MTHTIRVAKPINISHQTVKNSNYPRTLNGELASNSKSLKFRSNPISFKWAEDAKSQAILEGMLINIGMKPLEDCKQAKERNRL